MNRPLISVIIPAYNEEKNIETCLGSVAAQTWKHTEILVIDDGSTDATARIVRRAAERDGRIRLIQLPENRQLYHARLAGMEAAKGDYLLSVDADDQISEDYLEQLLLASLTADADLAICDDLISRDQDGNVLFMPHRVPRDRKYLLPIENVEYEYYQYNGRNRIIDQSYVVFWSKLYRRDLVDRAMPWLRQEKRPIIYTEDVLYAGVFLRLAKRTVFTHRGTYYYTNNPQSAMHATLPERLGKITGDQLETLYFLNSFLKQTGADARLMELYKSWKTGLWDFLELRYYHYRKNL